MPPYLTRKRTASNLQESESGNTLLGSKIIAKTKNVTNKMSKSKTDIKVTDRRSIIRTRSASVREKINVPVSLDKKTTEKENQKIVKRKKPPEKGVNNRIKNEGTVTRNGSTDLNKNKLKNTKSKKIGNERSKQSPDLRQMSLKESFVNLSRIKILHTRNNANNIKNDLKPAKEDQSPKLKDSVLSEKKLNTDKEKLPVYKCASLESSKENTNEIYEFKFDVNDSTEKLPKKRKKMAITKRTLLNKKKKNIFRKRNLQETEVGKKVPTNLQSKEVKEEKEVNQPKEVKEMKEMNLQSEEVKQVKETENDQEITEKDSVDPLIEHVLKEDLQENLKKKTDTRKSEEAQNTNKEQVTENNIKPTIVLVEDLSNKRFAIMNTSNVSNSDTFRDFLPFRPTNVFKNEFAVQQRNMLNHSLFEKSLSPIIKATENPEISSPWRAPQLLTFPQVKNVFHSTPQNRKCDIVSNRFTRSINNERKSHGNTPSIRNIVQRNDKNASEEGYVNTVNLKKKNPISRKFGTEITNINQSLQSNQGEGINETVVNEVENVQPTAVQTANTINLDVNNTLNSDDNENKKNSMPNYESPTVQKKHKKKIKSQSPEKSALNIQVDEQKENLDPQPGPSGLQNRFSPNNQRVLRQSNLNNFLDIMDMPENTIIRTPHRIFEDTYSTPVSSTKSVKKIKEPIMELKNAFGFIDDDSDQDVSTVEYKTTVEYKPLSTNDKDKQEKAVQTNLENYNKPATRLSIGEIKNKLLVKKLKDDIKKEQNVITEKKLNIKKSPLKERKKNKIDIASFSDTFDVLSEMDESSIGDTSDVPLFADLEPVHFTQPPRYSYKRKRPVKYCLSDESENEEEEEEIHEHEVKRKKGNKMKLEQEKRLIDWVDNINKTFSEVDQHELVIE